MRGSLLDLISVWILGKEKGREIEKEREGYGSCSVCWAKTNLRNKMENDFLTDSLMLYIEKDIASTFSLDLIVDDFEDLKERRIPFS